MTIKEQMPNFCFSCSAPAAKQILQLVAAADEQIDRMAGELAETRGEISRLIAEAKERGEHHVEA